MNERQKKIMVPYEEPIDTCPDCSNHPCDCKIPAGYTPTPRKNKTAVRLYDEAQVFEGSRPSGLLIQGGDEILRLERELTAITEQLKAARRLAEKYRNLSCESQEEADVTLLPWEGGADES